MHRFVFGSSHACLACRTRSTEPGACPRCNRPTHDLATAAGQAAVARWLARVAPAPAPAPPPRAAGLRERAFTLFAHACALGGAAAAVLVVLPKLKGVTDIPVPARKLILAGAGLLAGYLGAAMIAVLAFALAAALAAAVASSGAVAAAVPALGSLALERERGAALRARVADLYVAALRAVLAPVRWLRADPATRRRAAPPPAQLAPLPAPAPRSDAPDEAAAASTADAAPPVVAIEGVLTAESELAALGSDLAAPVIAARGRTRGVALADALAAPALRVRTDDGALVTVRLEVGELALDGPADRDALLGDGAPRTWGVPARPAPGTLARARFPAAEPVNLWLVPPGARVRIEGGALRREPPPADAPEGYRDAQSAAVLHATRAHPARVTVLERPAPPERAAPNTPPAERLG